MVHPDLLIGLANLLICEPMSCGCKTSGPEEPPAPIHWPFTHTVLSAGALKGVNFTFILLFNLLFIYCIVRESLFIIMVPASLYDMIGYKGKVSLRIYFLWSAIADRPSSVSVQYCGIIVWDIIKLSSLITLIMVVSDLILVFLNLRSKSNSQRFECSNRLFNMWKVRSGWIEMNSRNHVHILETF